MRITTCCHLPDWRSRDTRSGHPTIASAFATPDITAARFDYVDFHLLGLILPLAATAAAQISSFELCFSKTKQYGWIGFNGLVCFHTGAVAVDQRHCGSRTT